MLKSMTFRATLTVLACGITASAYAIADTPKRIDVPPGELSVALQKLAEQSGVEFVYSAEQLKGVRTNGIQGEYTADKAVTKLLEGTQLNVTIHESGALLISDVNASGSSTPRSSTGAGVMEPATTSSSSEVSTEPSEKEVPKSFWKRFRLAQNDSTRSTATTSETGANADQADGPERLTLEEVIVTAQKREERLIDVPISIVALGGDELQNRRIANIDDLRTAVPGLAIVGSGGFQRRMMLRGISNTFGSSSLIGMYLDEAAVSPSGPASELDLRTYDLRRVEVLRGPQGTLYGAGSVGGTIRFITEDPQLDGFATKADLTASFTEEGEPSQRLDGVVNVPLVEDVLGLRIAGTFDNQGGWVDQPALGTSDINGQEVAHVRVKGLWRPTSAFNVNAMAVVHRNDGALGSRSEDINGNFTQLFALSTTPKSQDDYEIYNLTLTYDFPAVRLLSASSYLETEKDVRDYGSEPQIAAPPAPALRAYNYSNLSNNQILTQEVRLMSQGSGPWTWTTGAFYRDDESDSRGVATQDGLFPNLLYLTTGGASESWAVFADVNYQLTQALKIGAGVRYFEDERKSQNVAAVAAPATLIPTQTGKFDTTNPRVYVQYKWTDDLSTYASAAKGFRSGGFNQVNQPAYDPESVWTYELGTKMSLAGGRVGAEAALFYSDYTDYQVVGLVPGPSGALLTITSNAGNAMIKGVECGLTWHPTDQLHLSVSGSYTDSEFYEIDALNSAFAVGDRLDLVPDYSYTVSVEHELNWSAKPGFVRLDYSEQGRSSFRNRRFGPWYFGESDVINYLNLNTSLQWSDSLSFGVFAENLLNERGYTSPFAASDNIATRARPRTFGVQFGVSFE